MTTLTCNRCDGMGEVVELQSGDMVTSAPACPHTSPTTRLKCAACDGAGKLEGDGNCERRLKFAFLSEFSGWRHDPGECSMLCDDCHETANLEE